MSQNSTGPRDQPVRHQPENRHKPVAQSEQAAKASREAVLNISEPLIWRLVVPDGRTVLIAGDLRYKSTDPHAVCITFRVHDDTLDWLFARTLLISGLHEPVGAGDVEIRPCHRDGLNTVQITLKARYAYAVLEAPAWMIAAFLKRTCRAVPLGTEHRHLDLDDLARLLVHNVD
jgi:hypothetical protein